MYYAKSHKSFGDAAKEVAVDIYSKITNQIVELMEKADAKGWHQPWLAAGREIMQPKNALTHNPYHGINVLALWASAQHAGFSEGVWATYKQWMDLGAQVKKGEKGSAIVFWKILDRETEDAQPDAEEKSRSFAFAKTSWVFAAEQVSGFTPPEHPPLPNVAERIERAEEYIANTGIRIEHGGNAAFYRPADDIIRLPPREAFTSTEGYYSTKFHELEHATGAKHRLNRDLTGRFGSQAYAAEELIATIGEAFQCVKHGITSEPRPDHAHYLKNWLQVLRNDNKAIFVAASAAQKAVEYLDGLQPARPDDSKPAALQTLDA